MCELRNLTRKEKKFLINNNCDPKDYLFFKDLLAFKKDLP